jgi:hypothetical protein
MVSMSKLFITRKYSESEEVLVKIGKVDPLLISNYFNDKQSDDLELNMSIEFITVVAH